jgi:hypothetical protein
MSDVGSRMIRQQEYVADPGRDPLSADQHMYTDAVPRLQRAAADDAVYSGRDAERRLRSPDD